MDNSEINKPVAANDLLHTKTIKPRELDFKYFPAFAQFILDNKLKEFALETIRLSREVNLPALKFFSSYSEEQLIQISTHQIKGTLKLIAANKAKTYVEDSLKIWRNNELSIISKDVLVADDFTLQSFVRRKIFRDFLRFYTSDIDLLTSIMEEIDLFVLESETAFLNASFERQQSLYKQAQALARIGNWLWDLRNDELIWSDELYHMYELTPGSKIDREKIGSYNHPEDKQLVLDKMRQSLETGKDQDFYYRIILPGNREKTLHAKGQVLIANNKPAQFFGTLQDVTEQKNFEKELKEQQTFIQKIADVTPSLIAAYNIHTGQYVFINKALKKLLGYDPEDVLMKGVNFFIDVMHPDDLQPLMEKNAKVIALANQPDHPNDSEFIAEFQYRLRNRRGEYRWFHTYGTIFSRNSKDEVEYVLNISMDITEQHLLAEQLEEEKIIAETKSEELRRSEERYHHMISEVEDYAILLLDKDGIVKNWNKGAEKIKGYKAEEIIGKSFRTFYTKEDLASDRPDRLLKQAVETGKASDEGWRVRKDGQRFWGNITITALHDENNNIIGFTKLTRDLTERKFAEDKIYEYAKQLEQKNEELKRTNKELESFNYVASHDLQEPLRKIQVFSNAILSSEINNLSEKGKEYFSRMHSAANRMRRLIEDLLAFSRATVANAEFEYCDLNSMLQEVLSTLKFSIEETHAIIESEKLPVANVIPFQFRQVLQNLISNAIKYRKQEVAPVITITSEKVREKFSGEKIPREYIKLSISDNGIGFEQQHAERIFELFQRLHTKDEYPGTGIGLAICKKIIQNHNGVIKANAEPGKGAAFDIYLPV